MDLKDRNIVITGGTSGIGREVVRRLHRDTRLTVIASHAGRLEQLASEFNGVVTLQADLSDLAQTEAAARRVLERMDRVDVLINNAAIQHARGFIDADFEFTSIQREITLNFTSVCVLIQLLLPAMRHETPTAIVNVNSGLALAPKTSSAVYCATKGALNIFSQSLRYQLEGTNIKVWQAFMPLVDTPMTAGRGTGKLSAAEAAEAMIRGIEKEIPDHDIGKVRVLRTLVHIAPWLARRIMKAA